MGDLNAVDISQATHEAILQKSGGLRGEETLRYHSPFPKPPSRVYQGVYVDDHLVVAIVPQHAVSKPEASEDSARIQASHDAY